MFTIEPPPFRFMTGTTSRMPRKTPVWSTAIVLCQISSVISSRPSYWITPALLTRMSMRPYRSTASPTACFHASSLETSRWIAWIASESNGGSGSRTSPAITCAPSCAKSSAVVRPMPRAAPVISATLPSRRAMSPPFPFRGSCPSPRRVPPRDGREPDGEHEDPTGEDVLVGGRHAEDAQAVDAGVDEDHADDRADDVELAVAERRRAEEDRREGGQQVAVRGGDRPGADERGEHHAGEGGAGSGHDEGEDLRPVDGDAREPRRLG